MYIQITTVCNMHCAHCGFSCEHNGEYMSRKVWMTALRLYHGDTLVMGGGEPTLHPDFDRMLKEVVATYEWNYHWLKSKPSIVTNGTHKQRSLYLLQLTLESKIDAYLSYDQYHNMNMVDDEVFVKYETNNRLWGYKERQPSSIVKSGRGRNIEGTLYECLCPTNVISPNGDVRLCGCDDSPIIGTIFKHKDISHEYDMFKCIRDYKRMGA
jgi:MoaA/NifB/PqqE/SkfB family radical SAM enzyme